VMNSHLKCISKESAYRKPDCIVTEPKFISVEVTLPIIMCYLYWPESVKGLSGGMKSTSMVRLRAVLYPKVSLKRGSI